MYSTHTTVQAVAVNSLESLVEVVFVTGIVILTATVIAQDGVGGTYMYSGRNQASKHQ